MTVKYTEAKLLHMSSKQKERLEEIKNEISEAGGNVSLNEIIRDSVNLVISMYRKELIEQYTPKKIKDIIRNEGR